MQDTGRPQEQRRLADVVREMKIAEADRLDAADREGEAARAKLRLLEQELEEVFEEAGGEDAGFDFTISQGATPRLWIDAATHVIMGSDGVTYRILRDARGGRTVLGETHDVDDAADRVTRYIATRSLERERLLDGEPGPVHARGRGAATPAPAGRAAFAPAVERVVVRKPSRFARFIRALLWLALGVLLGMTLLFVAYGERLGLENPVPAAYRPFYEPYVPALPGDAPVVAAPEATTSGEAQSGEALSDEAPAVEGGAETAN